MAGKTIPFRIKSEKHGKQVYQSGLKHRVLTAPSTSDVSIGAPVEIALELAYADRSFRLLGQVMHTGEVATIVQLDTLPAELYEVLGQRPPAGLISEELERTDESSSPTMESEPIQPSNALEETLRSPPRDPYAGAASSPVADEPAPAAAEPEPTPFATPTAPPVPEPTMAAAEPLAPPVEPATEAPAAAPRPVPSPGRWPPRQRVAPRHNPPHARPRSPPRRRRGAWPHTGPRQRPRQRPRRRRVAVGSPCPAGRSRACRAPR